MLEPARKTQLPKVQRLCNLASTDRIKYTPAADQMSTRIGPHRFYWVIGEMLQDEDAGKQFYYGLAADSGSWRGVFPGPAIMVQLGKLPCTGCLDAPYGHER